MDWPLLLKGLAVGFSIAAPVGPIGILCIQRTLSQGRLAGFVSGLGAATADAAYGLLAALGVSFLTGLLIDQQIWLRLLGGLFLTGLGARLLFSKPPAGAKEPAKGTGYLVWYSTTFFLTITNPMTIIAFSAVITGLGVVKGQALLLVSGVFLGSALWWVVLAAVAGLFRERINPVAMGWINRLAGTAIVGFGIAVSMAGIRLFNP